MWPVLLWTGGGDIVDYSTMTSVLNSDANKYTMTYFSDLIKEYKVSPAVAAGADIDTLFQTGKCAMYMCGPWAVAGFQSAGLNFDVAPVPEGPGGAATLGDKNSAIYTLAVLVLQIPFALLIAISIQRQCRRNDFFKTVYFIPAICSMSVISIIWSLLLNKDIGIVSYYLSFLGIHLVDWLNNPKWAMPAVVFISIWKNFGLTMIMLLAGLNNIPKHYYEAAEIDGASSWKKFWNITLPLLTPTLGFVTITTMIGSFQVFDQVYVMTKGGPLHKTETIVQYIYTMGIGSSKMAYACAMAMLLLVVLMFLTYICNRKLNQLERGLS